MARSKARLGPENWLYIASHALSLYLEEGGSLEVHSESGGIVLTIPGVQLDDPKFYEGFWELVRLEEAELKEG